MGDGHSFAMKKFNLELHPEKTRLLEFGPMRSTKGSGVEKCNQ
jgi:hypothetical protein